MRLTAKAVPHSSVVGGGLSLVDEIGRARFIVMFVGTTEGIVRAETEALSSRISELINANGLEVPER